MGVAPQSREVGASPPHPDPSPPPGAERGDSGSGDAAGEAVRRMPEAIKNLQWPG